MAGALRPVVILMLVASVLFVVDGIFDGVYPGGPAWFTGKYDNLAEIAYVFAIVNTLVAYFVARGSERSLIARMSLSVFFLIERPLTAFVLGPKPITSIATHFATALVELVILLSALRVWRLGRSYAEAEVDSLFALEGSTVGGLGAPAPEGSTPSARPAPRVPGGRAWTTSGEGSGWLVYLFAVVLLTVAIRAVHGGRIALRALIALSLVFFLERSFTPISLRESDPIVLALHGLAAFVSLALALAAASAIRGAQPRRESTVRSLEAA
ncbi:MAG: hypothetical protein E6I40_01940 [Chloroflexi bacterium]|nr:MAG: hypothetical protein E6I40_01940 [Chloroflexota bacterium]